jgi:hypothetical protein
MQGWMNLGLWAENNDNDGTNNFTFVKPTIQ